MEEDKLIVPIFFSLFCACLELEIRRRWDDWGRNEQLLSSQMIFNQLVVSTVVKMTGVTQSPGRRPQMCCFVRNTKMFSKLPQRRTETRRYPLSESDRFDLLVFKELLKLIYWWSKWLQLMDQLLQQMIVKPAEVNDVGAAFLLRWFIWFLDVWLKPSDGVTLILWLHNVVKKRIRQGFFFLLNDKYQDKWE